MCVCVRVRVCVCACCECASVCAICAHTHCKDAERRRRARALAARPSLQPSPLSITHGRNQHHVITHLRISYLCRCRLASFLILSDSVCKCTCVLVHTKLDQRVLLGNGIRTYTPTPAAPTHIRATTSLHAYACV